MIPGGETISRLVIKVPQDKVGDAETYDVEGEGKALPKGTSPTRYFRSEKLRTDGRYDFLLKDPQGQLWHFKVAQRFSAVLFSFGLRRMIINLQPGVQCTVRASNGMTFDIVSMDEGYGSDKRSRAREAIKREQEKERCEKNYTRVRHVDFPLPSSPEFASAFEFCLGKLMEEYDMDQMNADYILGLAQDMKIAECKSGWKHGDTVDGLTKAQQRCWRKFLVNYCQNLPDQLPFTRDICQ